MMAGVRALRKIQLGREVTAGTEVNATTIWRGTGTIKDETEAEFVEEDVGYLGGVDRTNIASVGGVLTLDPTPATFQQLGNLLDSAIQTVTPAQDGAGSDYIQTRTIPTTSANSIKTLTVEGGDNQQEEQMLYGFFESFKLSGAPRQALMMSGVIRGRQVAPGTFTASVALPAVEEINFGKFKLYIDAAGGSYGGTIKSNTLIGFDLDVDTGWRAKFTADGQLYFGFTRNVGHEITLDITFEHDAIGVAAKADHLAETARLVRLIAEGSAFTTGGTTYSNHTLIIDLPGKFATFDELGEIDGNDVLKGRFVSRYNGTVGDAGKVILVNELSSIT